MSIWAAAGSIAAPIIGGIIGNEASRKDRNAAKRMYEEALAQFSKVDLPDMEKQKLAFEMLKSQGNLTPEMEQALQQERSEMEGISADPRLREAQLSALSKMQEISDGGGMAATDKVRFNEMQSDLGREEQASRGAIMQDMARRGQSGSGMELASQLMSQQGSADRASKQGMDIKAQAERRALESFISGGQMAGNLREQDFGEQSSRAQAQDTINRFNTSNRQDVLSRNVGRANDAQQMNLSNNQRIADGNVGLRNQQQTSNKALLQQQFDNQMGKAAGMAGQYSNLAQNRQGAADRTAQMYAGIGAGIGQGFASYGQKKKDDDSPDDASNRDPRKYGSFA